MDDFDDLDSLLDMEASLVVEPEPSGGPKRNLSETGILSTDEQSKRLKPASTFEHHQGNQFQQENRDPALPLDLADNDMDDDEFLSLAAAACASQAPLAKASHAPGKSLIDIDTHQQATGAYTELGSFQETTVRAVEPENTRPYEPPARDAIAISGPCLTVTSPDGERVYSKLYPDDSLCTRREAAQRRRHNAGLLSCDITQLISAVEKDQFERALAETAPDADEDDASARRESAAEPAEGGGKVSSLWVDRYAPTTFMDLLGNEQINRDVVHWLKSWDACVFGGPKHKTPAAALLHGNNKPPSKYTKQPDTFDALGRPEYKVLLLSGSPGIGKTTLAHVVARHCGYRPFEINASDDRNSASLMARVTDAVEMQSMLGEKLPNCVIIDEIDGAAGGAEGRSAISALLKVINAAPRHNKQGAAGQQGGGFNKKAGNATNKNTDDVHDSDSDDDDDGEEGREGHGKSPAAGTAPFGRRRGNSGGAGTGKQAKQRLRPLMRPIICICNDVYAPALRPLRDVARVFHFKKPMAERLVQRLQSVCAAEGLRAEKSTLRLLTERTDCDIRSCLNTLQFMSKRQTHVRQDDLAGLSVGQKDMTKGAFQIWTELFQTKKKTRSAQQTLTDRFTQQFTMLQDFGEEDLVLNGIHENLPNATYMDMTLQRTSHVFSLLQDADHLMRTVNSFNYVPAIILSISGIIATHEKRQLQWPKTAAEAVRRATSHRAVLQQWLLNMTPSTSAALGWSGACLDVLPRLPWLVAPALRPVSFQLLSKEEKATVSALVSTMIALGLNFSTYVDPADDAFGGRIVQNKDEQPLQLKPPVHQLWSYEGLMQRAAPPAAAVRQLIAHEVELEHIRRAEAARQRGGGNDDASHLLGGQSGAAAAGGGGGGNGSDLSLSEAPPQQGYGQQPGGGAGNRPISGPIMLDLAARLRESGPKVKAMSVDAPAVTWLDKMREVKGMKAAAAKANKHRHKPAGHGDSSEEGGSKNPAQLAVLYKYHEGFTNAVKRPVVMQELL